MQLVRTIRSHILSPSLSTAPIFSHHFDCSMRIIHNVVCCRVTHAQKDDKFFMSGFLSISSGIVWSATRTINLSTSFGRSGLYLIILMVLIILLFFPPKLGNEKALEPKNYLSVSCFMVAASIAAMTPAKLLCHSQLHCELLKPLFFPQKMCLVQFQLNF